MLDEHILAAYKARAAHAGRSLSSMIEEAMRVFDKRENAPPRPERWKLPVGSPGAYLGKANPLSNAEVLDETEREYGRVDD